MYDYAILNGKLYIDGAWVQKNLYVQNEKIALIDKALFPSREVMDAQGLEVLPGVIDPHVHFDLDLGWIHSVDDFYYGSVAAAFGGVTSIIDFLDPASNAEELEAAYRKRLALASKCQVDYQFHATIKKPTGNLEAFVLKMKGLGMHTLKLFTTYSDSGRRTYDESIIELLKLSNKHHFLIEAHIENDDMIKLNPKYTYKDLLISRPSESETTETLKLAGYVRKYGGHFYMVHLSSGRTLEALVKDYSDILNKSFFVESCPQYFTFTSDVLQKENGYLYSFAPPLRSIEEQRLLFDYADRIDTIGTDHCAFNRSEKMKKSLKKTPLGIGGIEFSLPVMRHHLGDAAINKMTLRVASLMGLDKKGKLEVGYDADLALFKPDANRVITISHGLADYSVYTGQRAAGIVVSTMVRGHFIMKDRQFLGGTGKWVKGNEII